MNLLLKIALTAHSEPAYQVAIKADINPNKLSRFVMEISDPSEGERERLAKVLERPVSQLFPEAGIGK